jgi:hypothetical protein
MVSHVCKELDITAESKQWETLLKLCEGIVTFLGVTLSLRLLWDGYYPDDSSSGRKYISPRDLQLQNLKPDLSYGERATAALVVGNTDLLGRELVRLNIVSVKTFGCIINNAVVVGDETLLTSLLSTLASNPKARDIMSEASTHDRL